MSWASEAYRVRVKRGEARVTRADGAVVFVASALEARVRGGRFLTARDEAGVRSYELPSGTLLASAPAAASGPGQRPDAFGRSAAFAHLGALVLRRGDEEVRERVAGEPNPHLASETRMWFVAEGALTVLDLDGRRYHLPLAHPAAHPDAPVCFRARARKFRERAGARWNDDVACVRVCGDHAAVLRDWYRDMVDRPRRCLFLYRIGESEPFFQADTANTDEFTFEDGVVAVDAGEGDALRLAPGAATSRGMTRFEVDWPVSAKLRALAAVVAPDVVGDVEKRLRQT